jgi:hypothetical protein
LGKSQRVSASCDDRRCVAPVHLQARTASQLLNRAYAEGRRDWPERYLDRVRQAQQVGIAKLDWDKARAIRALPKAEARKAAAAMGLGPAGIRELLTGKTWREPESSAFSWRAAL